MPDSSNKKSRLRSIGQAFSKGPKPAEDSAELPAEEAQDVATLSDDEGGSVATNARRLVGDRINSVRQTIPWESVQLPTEVLNTLSSSLTTSKALSASTKQKLTSQIGPALESLSGKGATAQAQTFATVQGLLANAELSRSVNAWLQSMVSGAPTIYDRAMDATYNTTHIGGGLHRMFDGGYTIPGAFEAVRNASPDDNIFQEAAGLLQALARDATTPMGLPLVNWDRDTFNGLSNTLEGLGISRDWLVDLVNYDAVELVGSSIGVVAIALNWNNDDIEEFTTIVGGMGLSATVGANPLLLVVTIVALAKAFHTARKTGDWKEFTDGLAKGGICTGAVLLVTSTVSGPAVVVLLTGICVGVAAHKATENVSIVEIGQFVVRQVTNAPSMTKGALGSIRK